MTDKLSVLIIDDDDSLAQSHGTDPERGGI